jgi:hypothetical protein
MKEKVTALYRITLLAALALTPGLSYAQTANEQNPNRLVVRLSHPSQPSRVTLQMLAGSISVEGYSGNEVIVEGAGERIAEGDVPAEARGMRRLSHPGDVSVDEDNNVVTIHPGFKPTNIDVRVPANSMLSLKTLTGSIKVQGVLGDLAVESTNGGVTLDQVGGSIVAHALNGGITANVVRPSADKPFSFSTLNGRIEVTLPASMRANLNMRSDHGDIYLDQGFDYKPLASSGGSSKSDSNGMLRLKMDNTIHAAINGGGVEISIRSFNGSILVHKGK